MFSTRQGLEGEVKASRNGLLVGNDGDHGLSVQHATWAHGRRPVRRSRLTVSILEKPKHGQQATLTRSSSSAGGYLRTSISVPRLPQHVVPADNKHKLKTSISVPRLPQHSGSPPPPPAPAPAPGPGPSPAKGQTVMSLQTQHRQHSHSLDELQPSRPQRQVTVPDLHNSSEVLMWVYRETTKLYVFSAHTSDAISSVHEFLRRTQKLNPMDYELAVLTPGLLYPVMLQNIKADLFNGVVLCLPSNDVIVTIQTQDREVFSTQANPLDTIEDVKQRIEDNKGYPLKIQDLTFDGQILRNEQCILDYNISQDSRLYLILQPDKKFPISVDTFWGVKYTIEVGPCTTVRHVIQTVLRKTMRSEEEASDFHSRIFMRDKPIYEGLLSLETTNNIMKENLCLGYYKIGKGAILRLTSTGEANRDNSRMVQVLLENGVTVHTNVAKYDNWHIVVLKLHGITGKPIDTMRLQVNDNLVELNCTIGTLRQANDITYAKLATLRTTTSTANKTHDSTNGKLQLEVKTVNGALEIIKGNPRDTIHDVKLKLEKAGVPEARFCDVLYKKVKLPTNSKLMDYKLQDRTQMELKMGEFPVQVMWATNTVKLTAQAGLSISELLARIETKTGASPIKAAITFAGRNLYDISDMAIQDSALYVHSTIYVEPLQSSRVLHLVTVNDVIPIPIRQKIDSLHLHQIARFHFHPEIFLKSMHWFIKWRFPSKRTDPRSSNSEVALTQSKRRSSSENTAPGRSVAGTTGSIAAGDTALLKPRRILDQRSRTMPVLNLISRDANQNHPLRQSFDFTDLNNSLRESGRSVVQIRSSSLDRRDRSLDRLASVVNIRENSPIRRDHSLDRAHERALVPVEPHTTAERPTGVTVFLPNALHATSDEMSSSLTPSSSSGSPSSIKSVAGGIGAIQNNFYNGLPPSRSESFPRRTHRQLPMLPNDMSPGSTPDSTPASKKKLQVRFELPTENGGSNGDTWDRSTGPVKSALKKGSKLYTPIKSASNYGMTISTRSRSVDSEDYPTTKPQWNQLQRSKTVVDYYSDQNAH